MHWHLSSVQLLSHVWLFVTRWTATRQASLSITNFQSLLELISIELVMPSNHLILCSPFFLLSTSPASGSFPISQFFTLGSQNIGVSASASVLAMNFQDWFHWCPSILKDQLSHHSSWEVFYFPICEISFISVPTEFCFSLSYQLEYFYYLESIVSQMRLWTWGPKLCFLFYQYLAYILIKIYWAGK